MHNRNDFQAFPNQSNLPNATAVLVLGIISIVGCFCYGLIGLICGIIALVLAKKDLALYRANSARFTTGSYNNLQAGRICAIIGTTLSAISLAMVFILLLTKGTAVFSDPRFWEQMQRR